jgi:nicotinamide-nucleotide amidase
MECHVMAEFTAEVIAIGDEMTSGARLDTNTQWLCQRLNELGVNVRFTSMVGDQLSDNIEVFRNASHRVDFVISTGGLGPTADDLTRESLAAVAGKSLVLHEPSLQHIESLFASRARPMPPRNRVQAMFPEGATDVFNEKGTAPGIDLVIQREGGSQCRIFALPGVPAEMKEMFTKVVADRIVQQMGGDRPLIRHHVVKCFGLGESEMEARLGEMISRQSSPRVGITVSAATISLRITAFETTDQACEAAIERTRKEIYAKASEFVYGEGEFYELHDAVGDVLEQVDQRLAVIEVGYAAPVSNWLAEIRQREYFAGGRVQQTFDGDFENAALWGKQLGADWVLIVDAYPNLKDNETIAETRISIVPTGGGQAITSPQRLGGHPSIVHPRIGKMALFLVRKHLLA